MTKEPSDKDMFTTLNKVLKNLKDYYISVKDYKEEEWKDIAEDFQEAASTLEDILKETNSIDELSQYDEDTIGFVFECLEEYADAFEIDHTSEENLKRTEAEYEMIQSLLDLFC